MKKNLILVVVLGLMLSVTGMVLATGGSQVVSVNGTTVINVTLEELAFGAAIPGVNDSTNANLILNPSNNVNLSLDICLKNTSDPLFIGRLEIDFVTNLGGNSPEILPLCGVSTVSGSAVDVDDDLVATSQSLEMGAILIVPLGTQPGSRATTIVYQITGPEPL